MFPNVLNGPSMSSEQAIITVLRSSRNVLQSVSRTTTTTTTTTTTRTRTRTRTTTYKLLDRDARGKNETGTLGIGYLSTTCSTR